MKLLPIGTGTVSPDARIPLSISRDNGDIAQTALDVSNEPRKREQKFVTVAQSSLKFPEIFHGLTYVYFVAIMFVHSYETSNLQYPSCSVRE